MPLSLEPIPDALRRCEFRACAAPWNSGVHLLFRSGHAVGINIVMETVDPAIMVHPTATIGNQEAQLLMDDLWQAGIRPTEGSGSAGAMRATERHLEDLRRLVFADLKKE